jgi:alkanesulfonate monooxygenase SsuD/methylene tetrahydromethanopterin reductase-like flavin-dependent oxidoreductase (luciferase family)
MPTAPPAAAVRFGVWAIVHGGWATDRHPDDPCDPSWARNRDAIQLAEALGFDSTLVAQHTINPQSDDLDRLEAWSASAALAAVTFWGYAELDAKDKAHVFDNADHKAVMFEAFRRYPAIGTNGGTAAGLVGTYDQVAERIRTFQDLGIELVMLQFQPFEAEMRRFAEHVIPRVRAAAVPA